MKAATATTHVTNRSSRREAALRNRPGGVARHLPGSYEKSGRCWEIVDTFRVVL